MNISGKSNLIHIIKQAPHLPGVYRFLDIKNQILYIGKAKDLNKRLHNYINVSASNAYDFPSARLTVDKQDMIRKAHDVKWYITESEEQALFLEAELIEKFKPLYNFQYRYGKNYSYITFSKQDFPRMFVQKNFIETEKLNQVFGPFEAGQNARMIIENICQVFKLRTCKDSVFKIRKRPCLEYDLNRCSAPCVGYITKEDYAKNVLEMKSLFSNNSANNDFEDQWMIEMNKAIEVENYELANAYYKKLASLNHLKSLLPAQLSISNADFFIVKIDVQQCVFVLGIRDYRLKYQTCLVMQENEPIENVILRWYVKHKPSYKVYTNVGLSQDFIQMWAKKSVHINLYRFEYDCMNKIIAQLLDQANQVIKQDLQAQELYSKFAKELKVDKLEHVEVYDNSHMGGKWNVGVKIVWGIKTGFNYKAYKVWKYAQQTNDDYYMMRKMLQNRFSFMNNNISNNQQLQSKDFIIDKKNVHKADILPDLIIIDGGMGQLNAVTTYIPVMHYALSKHEDGDKLHGIDIDHKQNYIVPISHECRLWLMKIRDEAHRFAVSEHSKLKIDSMQENID